MKRPHVRFTIRTMMVAVAVIAANTTYLRWFGVRGTPVGTRLILPILQIGLLCAIYGTGSRRRFCVGFAVFGVLALLGWFYLIARFPETSDEYFRAAMNAVLARFPLAGHSRIRISEPSHKALAEALMTIPQFVIAVAGGFVFLLMSQSTTLNDFATSPVEPDPPEPE